MYFTGRILFEVHTIESAVSPMFYFRPERNIFLFKIKKFVVLEQSSEVSLHTQGRTLARRDRTTVVEVGSSHKSSHRIRP